MLLLVLSVIPTSPWREPINWDLQATYSGDTFVSFSTLVRRVPMSSPSLSFTRFLDLPLELQNHILIFCDSATLYQLMQVSSSIRTEAKKLFWAMPDVWYDVDCQWVFAGGFPGHASHAIDVLDHVKQVQVTFTKVSLYTDRLRYDWVAQSIHGGLPRRDQTKEEIVQDFWDTLRSRFPSLTTVVLNDYASTGQSGLPENFHLMFRMCPEGIIVNVSLLEHRGNDENGNLRRERSLWKATNVNDVTDVKLQYELVNSTWTRRVVSLPPTTFRGPVGLFKSLQYQRINQINRRAAVRLLLVEARERHHFEGRHEPFDCFDPACESRFERPGEWALHAIETNHDKAEEALLPPVGYEDVFQQHEKLLTRFDHERTVLRDRILFDRGKEGSEKRREAEQKFLEQLEQDPLYNEGRPAYDTIAFAEWKSVQREY